MLQATVTGKFEATKPGTESEPPGGMIWLRLGFFSPPPMLTLWAIGEEFLATSVCPSRSATTCGSNMQQGWSMETCFSLSVLSFGWIGGALGFLGSEASTSQA